ncbi:hypothetical protein B0H10DRAFT_2201058 [Mycena sp. CBHHK59/15]|nr:hypothetical protein B0H10DRAFT_2201058 [Mycena sp. CBHHK59/15]
MEVLYQALWLDYMRNPHCSSRNVPSSSLAWGGNTKPWNDKDVIISFVLAGVCAIAFISWEVYMGDRAMTPKAIFKSRSESPSFPTVDGYHHGPNNRQIDVLLAIHPRRAVFLAVGSGLLYTLNTTTPESRLVGFQILAGVGIGMGMQNALLAMYMASFGQFLGGTLGLVVAEPVFASELSKHLLKYTPEAPTAIVKESPTAIYSKLPAEIIPSVVQAYAQSLRIVFVLGVPVEVIAALALLAAIFIDNIKIVKMAPPAKRPPWGRHREKLE